MKGVKFSVLAIVGLLVISGCYKPNWYRANTTHAELETDSKWCKGQTNIGATREQIIEQYEKCMRNKGYQLSGSATQKSDNSATIAKEESDVPTWNVGDSWRYRYTSKKEWQYTVRKIEGNLYIVEDRYGVDKPCFDKRTFELKFFLTPQGKKVTSETVWYYGVYWDFPIYVGRKWAKMFSGRDAGGVQTDYLHEFEVISYEDTAVPAGTFKSFKIEFSRKIMTRQSSVYRHYFWFSPEVKTIIKSSYAGKEGDWRPGSFDFELISFKLKDPKSVTPSKGDEPDSP